MSDKPATGPTPVDFFNWINQFAQPMMEASTKMFGQAPIPAQSDPLSVWKSLQEKNEQALTQFMAQLVNTPEFAANLGKQATSTAIVRENIRKSAQAYLEAANMPTREDITRVAGLVVAIDTKLDSLEEQLEEAGVDQTNNLLNTRLDQLQARLDRLDQQAILQAKISELETRQGQLDELNAKIDRLTGLETRLAQIEAKLDRLVVGSGTSQAVEPKPAKAVAGSSTRRNKATPKPTQNQEDK